ncbi:MAG: endonuclease/exonuclease/phosphatase family protein [Oscillospiraceae bacterium]|nr:endonuclease/exonuclease/phosphatase family protein [Oscillospiraceae bacterium]
MRIATWNVERLKHHVKTDVMLRDVEEANADILVLTETDRRFVPDYPYVCHTLLLREIGPDYYRETENRVSIYSRFPVIKEYKTNDMYACVCVELLTDRGNLLVYGTIMGIFGNREASFNQDLEMQMSDIRRLSMEGHSLCVIGDFNLSFADNYYYTKFGRNLVRQTFRNCEIEILTQDVPECIDHIAVSKRFAGERAAVVEWNKDKSLSDHKGIVVEIY